AAVNGRDLMRCGNRDGDAVPHGVYPCRGTDRWCAVSVWDDAEWRRLVGALGGPGWATDPRWETAPGRRAGEAELDQRLAEWASRLDAEEVMSRFQAAGVHAAGVRTMAELFSDPSLVHPVTDIGASIASGSFRTEGMVIIPCSIHTVGAVAHCISDTLLTRAADVCLKEGRRLVLVVRETPLHIGHLRTLVAAAESG